jgi:ABC-type branched-subunit amino acid transport system ATPase component
MSAEFGVCWRWTRSTFQSGGEIFGIIGPNGAGKTTLFNVINGVYPPTRGHVKFRGQDVTGLQPYDRSKRGIARTYQVVRPLGELTVRENVTVGACFGRENLPLEKAEKVADEVLDFVGCVAQGNAGEQAQCCPEETARVSARACRAAHHDLA